MSKTIAFTTSFPVEVVFAAGHKPLDLNNVFVTGNAPEHVYNAELKGFPRTICSWIKGNYHAAHSIKADEVLGVVQGDCANSQSLLEILAEDGFKIWHFSFPPERDRAELDREIRKLEEHYGVSRSQTQKAKQRLDQIRLKLAELDRWTWKEGLVSGLENHYWLVNSSDFQGDPDRFEEELDQFMKTAARRDPFKPRLRLAYLGVPPIYKDLYDTLHKLGGEIVFNEVQRQFAMPTLQEDILDQYLLYTYPYSIRERLEDIKTQLSLRKIEAVVSYTQSFCHLQIDNILLKRHIPLPFLTLEGDQPEAVDSRTLLRLESFMEVHG
ncbi:MAG TPA: 2-hydroxyacyl-CoA dehydratase [Candidatus Cloacimonadota bacterium]|nr:2-hydroxyacyl-CoA dehydratase [Candidatus Cloacimonadota bacterium]